MEAENGFALFYSINDENGFAYAECRFSGEDVGEGTQKIQL